MSSSQYFYARNQRLKLQINLASCLVALNNKIKSYSVATHAYRLDILNAVMTMVDKLFPMSLLHKQVLKQILNSVTQKQITSREH